MNPQNAQQMANNYMGQATTAQANYPNFQAQTLQGNINQAGLPQAAGQQQLDYNTFAQMFQNDPYGQQYMSQNFNNAGSMGSATGTPVGPNNSVTTDPLLANIIPHAPTLQAPSVVSDIPQLTPQNIGQGFKGFTNPIYGAEARNQQLSNVAGTMNAIQSLIGNNWTAVQNASQQTDQTQLAKIQALMNLANFYQQGANASSAGGGTASASQLQQQNVASIKKDVQKGATLEQLMQKYVPGQSDANTIMQIYKQYNFGKNKTGKFQAGKGGWGDPTNSTDQLAGMGVTMKDFTPAKSAAQTKQEQLVQGGVNAVKSFGKLMKVYNNAATKMGPVDFLMPGSNEQKQFTSQRDLYLGSVSKQLSLSRSNQQFQRLQNAMPSDLLATGVEGSFRGHLSTLLDISGLIMVVDKKGNTGVIPPSQYDPITEQEIDPSDSNVPFDEIQNIIGGLR